MGHKLPSHTSVLFQRLFINYDLPACAAGILTLVCSAMKFFIIIRYCIYHGVPFLCSWEHYTIQSLKNQIYRFLSPSSFVCFFLLKIEPAFFCQSYFCPLMRHRRAYCCGAPVPVLIPLKFFSLLCPRSLVPESE